MPYRVLPLALLCAALLGTAQLPAAEQPNILWITAEDHGPHLGAYGDSYATTPVIDALAAKGVIYRNAWSTAPVCAPARTTLISGVYPPSSGSQHMRSMTRLPSSMRMYPQYLREAGYYATNNSKEDYNLEKPGQVWDESSREAHWRKRKKGQPFFSIFNFTQSHESRLRIRPHEQVHDPAGVRVPAYHPDTPEVRQDWAQYYDTVSQVDTLAGGLLDELEADGLADDTIVFYYSDHGSGMPRNKRWTYNSGLQVAMVVYFPEKWRHLAGPDYRPGGANDRLVGFIDLAPTALSLAGIEPLSHMQGHAFLGKHRTPEQPYIFGFRDRMDERYDMVRAVRDHRYIYIRNFKPHKIYGQYIQYMFQTPTTRVWFEKFGNRPNNGQPQADFWHEKPAEELYDLLRDRDEVMNLAQNATHREVVVRMRSALESWQAGIRDLGFLPEGEIHLRAGSSTPYEMGHDDYRYPYEQVRAMASNASSRISDLGALRILRDGFGSNDAAVRYWAALGALMRSQGGVREFNRELFGALDDESPFVRIAAAEALGRFGSALEGARALETLLELAPLGDNSVYVSMAALNAIDYMDERAAAAKQHIAALPKQHESVHQRMGAYVANLIEKTLADLD